MLCCRSPCVLSSSQGFWALDLEHTGHLLPAQPQLLSPEGQTRFQNYFCAYGWDEVISAHSMCRYFGSEAGASDIWA